MEHVLFYIMIVYVSNLYCPLLKAGIANKQSKVCIQIAVYIGRVAVRYSYRALIVLSITKAPEQIIDVLFDLLV